MGINGKQKGSAAERALANEFSAMYNDVFRRVPQSGAMVGGLNREKNINLRIDAQQVLAGDLICPEWFPFSVESKCYGEKTGMNFYALLSKKNDRKIEEWLTQSKGDAAFARREHLLIIRITRRSDYCVVSYDKFIEVLAANDVKMPEKYLKYKDSIFLDKDVFLNNFIDLYLPIEKRRKKDSATI